MTVDRYPALRPVDPSGRAPRSSFYRSFLVGVGLGLVGAVFGILIARYGFDFVDLGEVGLLGVVVFILGAFPIFFLCVLVHELGHLVTGWLAGFRCLGLILGPIEAKRDDDKLSVKFNSDSPWAGGFALCVPQSTENLVRRTFLLVAGGPGASLLGAAAGWAFVWMTTSGSGSVSSLLQAWIALFSAISLFLATASLVPSRAGRFLSDGARLLRLARGGLRARRDAALMALVGLSFSALRPRDWPQDLIQEARQSQGYAPFQAAAELFSYYHEIDRDRPEKAAVHLQSALDLLPQIAPAMQGAYAIEAAFYDIALRQDSGSGRRWLEQARGQMFADQKTFELVKSLLAYSRNPSPAARSAVETCLENLPDSRGPARARKEWTREALARWPG